MMLTFATSNAHKVAEIRSLLPKGITIQCLSDIGFKDEIIETSPTIEGNSLQKAKFLSEKLGIACFAEDTGLEIEVLNGRPGVYSARYAGERASYADNVQKVLVELEGKKNRRAQFKTVITYYDGVGSVSFTGLCEGEILTKGRGEGGFGYDPIFVPTGCNHSFAEMRLIEKNEYSHRRKALDLFLEWLKNSNLSPV